jgi:hypothetical protein
MNIAVSLAEWQGGTEALTLDSTKLYMILRVSKQRTSKVFFGLHNLGIWFGIRCDRSRCAT